MKRLTTLFGFLLLTGTAAAQQPMYNPWLMPQPAYGPVQAAPAVVPFPFPVPLPIPLPFLQPPTSGQPSKPYTMNRAVSAQTKRQLMATVVPIVNTLMNMSMKDAMNYMATKIKVKPGLSFDDVVESMMLRANKLNFKYVGNNLMWKDFRAVLNDQEAPRVEVYSFCDIAVGRDLLKVSPEFVVFLPCRIAVMEDSDKNIWVLSLDWDITWLGEHRTRMGVPDELYAGAVDIRKKMDEIMAAGANGEL